MSAPRRGGDIEAMAMAILDELGRPVPLDLVRLLQSQKLDLIERPLPGGIPGMIHLASGTIVIDPGLSAQERRLVICHEVAHGIIPEHQLVLLQRSELHLGWRQRNLLRGQANRFAATLLFGGAPDATIADSEISLNAVRSLAALANAPLEAAFHRFVTRYPGRVWGLGCGMRTNGVPKRSPLGTAVVPVSYALASTPAIWCGTPRIVRLPSVPAGSLDAIRPVYSRERLRRAGARSLEWTEHPHGVLVLLR